MDDPAPHASDALGPPGDPGHGPPHDPRADLELSPETMRALGEDVLGRVVEHLAALPGLPAGGTIVPEVPATVIDACRALPHDAPEKPQPLGPILDRYFDEWLPATVVTPGPGYLAYVPGGGLYTSALASFLAAATNRYTGVWATAPLLAELEGRAIGWLRTWMEFPDGAAGLLTAGGSASNQTAIISAREKHLGAEIRPGTMYVSDQVHHCVTKSARLAGIHPDRVRTVPTDDRWRIRPEALAVAIAADRAAGLRPFLVVSSAGTTNTGAVDPLAEIGAVARDAGVWHHVDAAYGGCFHLVPELRTRLAGLSDADSITLDPHKGLFLPLGTGALLVREGEDLRAAHEMTAGYLPPLPDPEFHDPSRIGPELSRPYRGLPLWLAVQLHGVGAIRAAIAEKVALAAWAADRLRAIDGIELADEPQLSIVPFRVRADDPTDGDRRTRALLDGVNRRGRVFISGAWVGGRFLARFCILSFRTRAERVAAAVEDVGAALRELEKPPR